MSARFLFRYVLVLLLVIGAGSYAHADELNEIIKRGDLRVGVSLFAPWAMQDKEGKLHGFEIDVAEKIAADMGVNANFIVYPWDKIIQALQKDEIDVIIAGMAITPGRALQVNFSSPYAESGVSLATNTAMTRDIGNFKGLNTEAITITTVRDTLSHELAKRIFDQAKVKVYTREGEAAKQVVDGKAHAYMASVEEVKFLALQHPKKLDVPLEKPLLTSKSGVAVKRGEQELLNFINAWIVARDADKWLATTHKHWFNKLDWMEVMEK